MEITITDDEIEELKDLVEKYEDCPADGSYWTHLSNYALSLLVEKGVIRFTS